MDKNQTTISLFPLPEVVLFPRMSLPLYIFEDRYKKLILSCLELESDKKFGIVYAEDNSCAEVGTIAEILDVEKLEDGRMNVLTEGKDRFKILEFLSEEPYFKALIEPYDDKDVEIDDALDKSLKQIRKLSTKALKMFDKVSDQELSKNLKLPSDPKELLFLVAGNLTCTIEEKQDILEMQSLRERSEKVLTLLNEEIQKLEVMLENKATKDEVVKNGKLKI